MKLDYMDKKTTVAIKGIALIFMFIHHFFTIPESYISTISYPGLEKFAMYFFMPLKICVPVFAFLTGYFYFFAKEKTFRYSLRKITDLLIPYWFVYIPFLCLALILGCYQFSIANVGLELFALRRNVMCFCWYVFFYYFTMLLMPLLTRFPGKQVLADILLLLILPAVLWMVLLAFVGNTLVQTVVTQMWEWFPCIAIGFLFAKYEVFAKIDLYVQTFSSKIIKIVSYFMIICLSVMGCLICSRFSFGNIYIRGISYELGFSMEMIYGAMFVYGTANLLQFIKGTWILRLLEAIGKKSMLMWFIHCIFFNVCKEKTQPILYLPRNPVLVVIFGLLLCFGLAALIEPVTNFVLKKKNALMDGK